MATEETVIQHVEGDYWQAPEIANMAKAAGGEGVWEKSYDVTITGSDLKVTFPAGFGYVARNSAGKLVSVVKTTATDVTVGAAPSTNPRIDTIVGDADGNLSAITGAERAATATLEEPAMTALAADEILLGRVDMVVGETDITTAEYKGRAIQRAAIPIQRSKSADQSITSNTTLALDADLQVDLPPNKLFRFRAFLILNAHATPDHKLGWSYPTGATMHWSDVGALASGAGVGDKIETDELVIAGNAADEIVVLEGVIDTGSTGGTFGLTRAQNTSDANNSTLIKDSLLEVEVVAGS